MRALKKHAAFGIWLLILFATSWSEEGKIIVGPNVQVSKTRGRFTHYEVFLAADPDDPNRLLGSSMVFVEAKNAYTTIVYVSFDGGKTWEPTLELKDFKSSGDPACAYGPDGSVYYVCMADGEDGKYYLPVYRSKDGGKTWLPPAMIPNNFHGVDREYIIADTTNSKFKGRVYIHGCGWVRAIDGKKQAADISVFRSLNGGETFDLPIKRASPDKRYVLGVGNNVVLSDGTLVCLFGELKDYWGAEDSYQVVENKLGKPNAWLKVLTSPDGGESLTEAATVGDFYMDWPPISSSVVPNLAVDPESRYFKDRLYAVWPDIRSGRLEVLLSYSADKGKTWSSPVFVNDDQPLADPSKGPNDLMPLVAVNKDGIVGVYWYDRRDLGDNLGWRPRFSASFDGGETFLPSVPLSEAAMVHGNADKWTVMGSASVSVAPKDSLREGRIGLNLSLDGFYFNGGHTAGFAADAGGGFHPFWIDNRTGIPQVWTATVRVEGPVVPHGSPELQALEDISSVVSLELTNSSYDRKENTFGIDAKLKNTSEATIMGPIKIRVLSLRSELGKPAVRNADNKAEGPGAIWDFTATLTGEVLKPKETSGTRRLEFNLSQLLPFRRGNELKFGVLNLEAQILGRTEKPAKKEGQ